MENALEDFGKNPSPSPVRFDILARLGYYTILIKGYIALYFIRRRCDNRPSFPPKPGLRKHRP